MPRPPVSLSVQVCYFSHPLFWIPSHENMPQLLTHTSPWTMNPNGNDGRKCGYMTLFEITTQRRVVPPPPPSCRALVAHQI
ncbi:hypothetical protein PHYPO_G00122420 [Pangasianodon hypophthalmus]|uniref:Uncharacterized protein n=1 Tax=Pangasianodon hypophthalmus TaxID=310915 RepID=A0A5N5L018_PANHP|nr:hypothetical protein PHYPO_G00122420 [Pangasianodon hypophthalmus]